MTVRCVERLQIAFKDIYCEFYVRLETRAQWSIFPISFDFFWHEGGMMEHFCNEKVWSVDQNEHFIFWDFHDFIFYASPPKSGGDGDDFRKATVHENHRFSNSWSFMLYYSAGEYCRGLKTILFSLLGSGHCQKIMKANFHNHWGLGGDPQVAHT